MMHKILTGDEPRAIRPVLSFNHETIQRSTRQSSHLTLRRATNNHGRRCFVYRAASLYNQFISSNFDAISFRGLKAHIRDAIRNM